MSSRSSVFKKLLAATLAILLAFSSIPGSVLFEPAELNADGVPVGDVIFSEPYIAPPPVNSVADINWFKIDHPGYDMAYTEKISETYNNGVATTDHVVAQGDDIAFYGYAVPPYADIVYTDLYDVNGISFVLRPVIMNFHTFSEAGFLFNGEFSYVGSKMYYTGYAVVLKCGNIAGMLENNPSAANTASLCLYYIDNEEWNFNSFQPGNLTTTRTLISVLKSGISNLDPTPYRLNLEVDSMTRAFDIYLDGALRASVTAADVEGGAGGPVGFGFYTGYYAHACSILTRIRFENIDFDIDVDEKTTEATVLFVDAMSGNEIRLPETVDNVSSGQKYKIVQPAYIGSSVPQFYYTLSYNSRGADIKSDIMLTYQNSPLRNITTLYYDLQFEGDITDITEKKARVNDGPWDNGTVTDPVLVVPGDEIEYEITVYTYAGGQSNQDTYGQISDLIPNGLIVDKTSITGTESATPIIGTLTWELTTSNEIIWTVPVEQYPISVSVKASIDIGHGWGTFVNKATVSVAAGSLETNSTYHEYANITVIEEYYWYDEDLDAPTVNPMPYPDLYTYLRYNSTYNMKGLPEAQAKMYIFKGYAVVDWQGASKFVPVPVGTKPSDVDKFDLFEDYGITLRLYYMPVYVTIHFVDESGAIISDAPFTNPADEMVVPLSDYYIKMSNFASFVSTSGKVWTYYDYELTAPPPVGAGKTLGTEAIYPDGGVPAFEADDMDSSKHITLYFTDKQAVKVYFKEYNNTGNVLHDSKTYFFDIAFEPALATRSTSGNTLYDDIDLTAAYGKIYEYVEMYSIDGGAIEAGYPGTQSAPCEITLYFRTSYVLIEQFHKNNYGGGENAELLADALRDIFGGEAFDGNPPASITVGGVKWKYIGYKVDFETNPINDGVPSIGKLTGDLVIIYMYEIDTTEETEPTPTPGTPGGSGGLGGSGDPTPIPTTTPTPTPEPTPDEIDIPDEKTPGSPFITDHVAYIIGYPEGDVRPENNISRAEVATVFFRLLTDEYRGAYWTRDNTFVDVAYADWYNTAVSVMDNMGIIKGYPNSRFMPDNDITRAELATIASRFADVMNMTGSNVVDFADIAGHWAEAEIDVAAAIGWVNGYPDGTFRPDQPITRAEFMTLVNRVLERVPEDLDDLLTNEMIRWPDNADTGAWYYLAVQEATNSHEPAFKSDLVPGLSFYYETWIDMMANRDWLTMETVWSEIYS